MKTYRQLMMFLKSRKFALRVTSLVERRGGANFIAERRQSDKTFRDFLNNFETDPVQQSTVLTVRLAYVFESAINSILSGAGFQILPKITIQGERKSDFGVRILRAGKVSDEFFEVKTTRTNSNSWTGATHAQSCGKVDKYILVNYKINLDYELSPLVNDTASPNIYGAITDVHFGVLDYSLQWNGVATHKSSFTQARIPTTVGKAYKPVLGSTDPFDARNGKRLKWCKIVREPMSKYRNKQNILEV